MPQRQTMKDETGMDEGYIRIFDTTLRDGEQSAHATLLPDEKLKIAKMLARMGVDVIEAGFPISSDGDFEAVKRIAQEVEGPYIAGLSRAVEGDIYRAWEAVKHAKKPMIHTFIASSAIHMEKKLKKTPDETLKMAVDAVTYAKSLMKGRGQVEFSPEDATRSEPEFLYKMIEAVIKAGADVINIPDTVGYALPEEFGELIRNIRTNVKGIENVVLSVHCHNDQELAVANSLAAVRYGANQVECTVNGIGERAGNASLEAVVMTLKNRSADYHKRTGIDTRCIWEASEMVRKYTGITVAPNKAIVGANAFKHSSGIHADGTIKDRRTYEIMKPEDIGLPSEDVSKKIPIGPRTGRKGIMANIERLGYSLTAEEAERAYQITMKVADIKKQVTDDDLIVIIEDEVRKVPEYFTLLSFNSNSQMDGQCTATVSLRYDGKIRKEAAIGDGPVDAAGKAIEKITGIHIEFLDFALQAVGKGKDAMGEVTLKVKDNGNVIIAKGVSTNIDIASVNAYMNAINKMVYRNPEYK